MQFGAIDGAHSERQPVSQQSSEEERHDATEKRRENHFSPPFTAFVLLKPHPPQYGNEYEPFEGVEIGDGFYGLRREMTEVYVGQICLYRRIYVVHYFLRN
jgi:hypothetical protein